MLLGAQRLQEAPQSHEVPGTHSFGIIADSLGPYPQKAVRSMAAASNKPGALKRLSGGKYPEVYFIPAIQAKTEYF